MELYCLFNIYHISMPNTVGSNEILINARKKYNDTHHIIRQFYQAFTLLRMLLFYFYYEQSLLLHHSEKFLSLSLWRHLLCWLDPQSAEDDFVSPPLPYVQYE